jgi:hypothetical protein
MKLLGCTIKMPVEKTAEGEEVPKMDYRLSLNVWKLSGPVGNDSEGTFRVNTPSHQGFYFEAEGTPDEVYNELHYQLMVYLGAFYDEVISIRFHSDDGYLDDVIARLNQAHL